MKRASSRQLLAFLGSVLPVLLTGSLQSETSWAADRPDFSGIWQLNEELSENPRDKMIEKMRGGEGRSGSGGGGKGGGVGGSGRRAGGGSGGRGGSRGQEEMQSRFQSMAARIKTLEVMHQDPELTIGFADGSSRTIYTDGRTIPDDFEAGVLEGEAKWKNNSEVIFKAESSNGGKLTEIYQLNPSGDMLFVTTKMEGDGRRPSIEFRRVYDRVLAELPAGEGTTDLDG